MEPPEKGRRPIPTCREMTERVTEYLERALPPRVRLGTIFHLMVCRACRAYFRQFRQTIRFLSAGLREIPAPEVEDRVLREIARLKSAGATPPAPGD